MNRRIENIVTTEEHVLRAVAVVGVDIDNGNPVAGLGQRGRGHGNRVEQAEAHGRRRRGVMSRRPHDAVGLGFGAPGSELLHSRQHRSGREQCCVQAGFAHGSVGIQVAAAMLRERYDPIDHLRTMNQLQLRPLRRPRCAAVREQLGVHCRHPGQCGSQAVRPLGMPVPGVVVEETLVGDHQHGPDRTWCLLLD